MNWVVPTAIVLLLVVVAVWFAVTTRESAQMGKTSAVEEVTWRGVITAVVVDYSNKSSTTEYYLDFGNGSRVLLDLFNANMRLKDHFAVYVGNFDKPVYVRGLWDGKVLRAMEVYD